MVVGEPAAVITEELLAEVFGPPRPGHPGPGQRLALVVPISGYAPSG
ncbi:MAG TPA: hypothetical protein VEZ42_15515 [Pseudonocardia sp.]|nr:hypothetical protein [Pseudonocardia sp.]